MNIFEREKTHFVSHRGFTPMAPENSLPSFDYAGRLGQWAIETDVRQTRDGVLVCCHNSAIDAYCNGMGEIAELTYDELCRFPIVRGNRAECFSEETLRIPTFEDYLAICRRYGSIPFVELKICDAERVIRQMRECGFSDDEVVMSSTCAEHLRETRRISREMFVHWIFAEEERLSSFTELGNGGVSFRIKNSFDCPPELIQKTHGMGLRVCLRAADSLQTVAHMKELGLDYLPTNCMHDA